MSKQFNNKGTRRQISPVSPSGSLHKRKKVLAINSEGKEVEGTVVFERKTNYQKPSFGPRFGNGLK